MGTTVTFESDDFFAGDHISLTFDDTRGEQITGTVRRKLSDIEEGCYTQVKDYVDHWLEMTAASVPTAAQPGIICSCDRVRPPRNMPDLLSLVN